MSHTPHAFENQIFEHYREKQKSINNAITLLKENNYTIIDLNGNIIKPEEK
tara:strand:- start:2263 stop:2415 length:153 start_codon:yes stop_codon:yes gene_type:complete